MDEVKRLPKRMRQVVVVRSQVPRHKDVADILGISTGRVGYLLATVGNTLRQLDEQRAERERPIASPRAARLRELEENTPEWLIEAIGRLPTRGKNASATVLAWRRAALAIDDYRSAHGWTSSENGLGPKPASDLPARRAHDRAERAVNQVREERVRQSGRSRDR